MKKPFALFLLAGLTFTACSGSSTPAKPSDQLLDSNIYTEATSGLNLDRCKDILDAKLKSSCTQVINDQKATNDAIAALDKSKCSKVSDERYRAECEKQVNTKVEAKNAEAKRTSIEQSAQNSGDVSVCDQIADSNQKSTCKYNVLVAKAIAKKDPSVCEGIGLQILVDQCKESAKK